MDLEEQLNWCYWFIGENKVQITENVIPKLAKYPFMMAKVVNEMVRLTSLKPPTFEFFFEPLEDLMEFLRKGNFSDFAIKVIDEEIHVQ